MEIPRPLLENLGLKAVSLLLAFLVWFNVTSEQVIERTVSVPVEFLNAPPFLEISNDYPRALDVHVSSRRRSLSGGAGISAVVNLQDAREGERIVPITDANIRKPDGVTILNITPSRITLTLERTWSKLIPVEPQVVGGPAPGYQITRVQTNPSEIIVTGPQSLVQKAVKAVTEPVNVSGAKSPVQHDVNVDVADSRLRIDRVNPVSVQVLIEEERTTERFTVPLLAGQGVRPVLRAVQLHVSYPKTQRKALKPWMFSAKLERPPKAVSGEEREVAPEVTVNKQLENIVRVDKVTPERVKVRIL